MFNWRPQPGQPVSGALLPSALVALAMVACPAPASAGPGYQLDSGKPFVSLGAEAPIGVAVDQASQNVYVAEMSADLLEGLPGQVEQFTAGGIPTANSPFTTGGEDIFTAVAVNPLTQDVYAYQGEGDSPLGTIGESKLSSFSPTGTLGASFNPPKSQVFQLAVDSSGYVYFPNGDADTIQVFDSSGALQSTIACGGCPGGAFDRPVGVAFGPAGKLYVVDRASGGRVVALLPSSGSYVYQSVLESGHGAVAVGVDTSSGETFVGRLENDSYHVVAYTSGGVVFDDFGAGLSTEPIFGGNVGGQIAVNATTHKLYLTDPGGDRLVIFERIASIPAPSATVTAPSSVGQVQATLKGSVNPKGHALTDCHFEYVDHANFQSNGYANATSVPCPTVLAGSSSVPVSVQVTGLTPGTDYDYRLLASGYGGDVASGNQAFETLPPLPPSVTTDSASPVKFTSATLRGTVNPNGGPISDCHFEYTDAADFAANGFANATSKTCSSTPSGTANVSVLGGIGGLSPGTEYRFRVLATNNSGTGQGVAKAFTTVAESCQTNAALCPPPTETPVTLPPPVLTPITTPVVRRPLRCRKGFKKKRVRGKLKCVKVKRRR